MHNHYAGNWYPYQDEKGHNPGVIVDPKSPVVVGAAIEFLARHGMLPQFKFEMKGRSARTRIYWGVMTDATRGIRKERILFQPAEDQAREEITEFTTGYAAGVDRPQAQPGRKRPGHARLPAENGRRRPHRPTEVHVKIKRRRATKEEEETLEVESVRGIVAGEDAILGENVHFSWRTLADERYYLDTGGLDNIEIGIIAISCRQREPVGVAVALPPRVGSATAAPTKSSRHHADSRFHRQTNGRRQKTGSPAIPPCRWPRASRANGPRWPTASTRWPIRPRDERSSQTEFRQLRKRLDEGLADCPIACGLKSQSPSS